MGREMALSKFIEHLVYGYFGVGIASSPRPLGTEQQQQLAVPRIPCTRVAHPCQHLSRLPDKQFLLVDSSDRGVVGSRVCNPLLHPRPQFMVDSANRCRGVGNSECHHWIQEILDVLGGNGNVSFNIYNIVCDYLKWIQIYRKLIQN